MWIKYYLTFVVMFGTMPISWAQNLKWDELEEHVVKVVDKVRDSVVSIKIFRNKHTYHRSGIVLDNLGHIVTVASSIRSHETIWVSLGDRQYQAKLVGIDHRTNLAVLKINATDLMPIAKETPNSLQPGAALIIVGNSYGLPATVSRGIVSGLDRTVWTTRCEVPITGLVQTDAAIYPGGTGGLVVDLKGRFVGMASYTLAAKQKLNTNQQKMLKTIMDLLKKKDVDQKDQKHVMTLLRNSFKNQNNINFVLSSHTICWVAEQIIQHKKVRRGWVGIKVIDSEKHPGVIVTHIFPKSPAKKIIQLQDRLVTVNGRPIKDKFLLLHMISHTLTDKKVEFDLVRAGQNHKVTLNLVPCPKKK